MNETLSWTLGSVVAGAALLSLATIGAQDTPTKPAPADRASYAGPEAQQSGALPARILADAYFDIAKAAPAPGFDDWFVRHELTMKGVAAQRGEDPAPEETGRRKTAVAAVPQLDHAEDQVQSWRRRATKIADAADRARIAALTAMLQVRYDQWLLLAEAGAPAQSLAAAGALYDDTQATLQAAARQLRMAAL